jgi:8-oxo-dGTP pyrophosphatase MutT (NUDIX family)
LEVKTTFSDFIEDLKVRLKNELPGDLAHQKMMSYNRPLAAEVKRKKDYRESAVLILFYPINEIPHIVFILRQSYDGVHSAQVGFPGGKKESDDRDLTQTALREANEELRILTEEVTILGHLSELYVPPSNFLISPFIGYAEKQPSFVKDDYEVAEIIEVPIKDILGKEYLTSTTINLPNGVKLKVPCYTFNDRIVWGATAMIVQELIDLLD